MSMKPFNTMPVQHFIVLAKSLTDGYVEKSAEHAIVCGMLNSVRNNVACYLYQEDGKWESMPFSLVKEGAKLYAKISRFDVELFVPLTVDLKKCSKTTRERMDYFCGNMGYAMPVGEITENIAITEEEVARVSG